MEQKIKPTTIKDVWTSLLAIVAIFTIFILIFEYIEIHPPKLKEHKKQILLPEEIQVASVGDILIIESIKNDTITIDFNNKPHHCNITTCIYNGQNMQVSNFISKHEIDTDAYLYDLTHFMNPSFTHEQIENYLFNNN